MINGRHKDNELGFTVMFDLNVHNLIKLKKIKIKLTAVNSNFHFKHCEYCIIL